jgi:hypothetical protein
MAGNGDQAGSWQFVVQLASAVSGLAALVYVIGATTIWLRARLIGLPAEIAVAHESRSSVIAAGLLGIVYVAVPYGLLALLGVGVIAIGVKVYNRRKHAHKYFFDVIHSGATRLSAHPLRIALVDAVAIGAASFVSWRAFAAAIGAVAAVGGAIRLLDPTKHVKALGTLGLALAALVTGLGWQITGRVPVQAVWLNPRLPGIDHTMPYFGETDQYIYVGGVNRDPANPRTYVYTHQIVELKRSKYLLTFNGRPYIYCRANLPPAQIVVGLLATPSVTPKKVQC